MVINVINVFFMAIMVMGIIIVINVFFMAIYGDGDGQGTHMVRMKYDGLGI